MKTAKRLNLQITHSLEEVQKLAMNALLTYTSIVEQFVKSTGLSKPEKNEEGGYTFVFGGQIAVDFTYNEQYDWFVLKTKVGDLNHQNQNLWLKRIATANLMWRETQGATLSLEPRSNSIVLANYRSLRSFDHIKLKQLLKQFLITAKRWQNWVQQNATNKLNTREQGNSDSTTLFNRLV